tara:strand:- start:44 stop:505 length:462 start_codon:yes stop_codon:yes gene_type:complete
MKTDGFIKLLRKVIREEVSKAIKTELRPLLNEVNNVEYDTNESTNLTNISSKPVTKKRYTKNTMLNDLLNETASTPASQELADWSTDNFKQEMAQANTRSQSPNMPLATSGINGEPVNMANEAVASTMNAMTRDYSGLIKAMDKKNGKMGTNK